MNDLVLSLSTASRLRSQVGGKAANLGGLLAGGFPVPDAFVVTTAAFHRFARINRLEDDLARTARAADTSALDELRRSSAALRQRIIGAPIPSEIRDAICAARVRLDDSAHGVAVRSSAEAEDADDASFAGMLDTFLNVSGEEPLLDAVKACWASSYSARVLQYRMHLRCTTPGHAVIVQRMVDATCAGVMFTVNPVSGSPDEIVIDAAWGLGVAVVDGRVTPDAFVLGKHDARVVRATIAAKATRTELTERGTHDMPVIDHLRERPAIDEGQAGELARLGAAIEAHFGRPQDIEWAIEDGRIWILQARPITTGQAHDSTADVAMTLEPGSDDWPALDERPPTPFDRWTLANVGEAWPLPVSPIVASSAPSIIGGALQHTLRGLGLPLDEVQWAKRWYGRVYFNEGALKHVLSAGLGLPAGWFDRSRGHRDGEHHDDQRFRVLPAVRRLPRLVRFARRQSKSAAQMRSLSAEIDRLVAQFRARGEVDGSDRDLLAELETWFGYAKRGMSLENDVSGHAFAQFALLERMIGRWTGEPHLAHDVMGGLAEIETADIGSELAGLASALRDAGLAETVLDHPPAKALALVRNDPRGAVFVQLFERFLEQHGHRCPNDAEWLNPRWAEAPEEIVDMVASYLRSESGVDPNAASREQQHRRRAATALIEARLNVLQRWVFRILLSRTQSVVRLRDNGKNSVIKACYPPRRQLHLLGRRWTARGWLSDADDVFFLTHPDLRAVIDAGDPERAGLDLRTLVAQRKHARAYWLRQPAHDALGSDGQPLIGAATPSTPSDLLTGIAASTGRVSGRARVVNSPRDAMRLGRGDILVTQATDTGWSAVFPLIGGLVTEIGGQLSHAAILAREYGLPTVVNVTGATSRIRDRDVITVDGGMGWVRLEVRTNPTERFRS